MSIFDDLKKKHLLCEGFDDDELRSLSGLVDVERFSKGDPVFRENGVSRGIYMVNSGGVEITKKLPVDLKSKMLITLRNMQQFCEIRKTTYGWKQVFANFIEGHFFGDLSVVEGREKHSADAYAIEDTELFFLSREKFDELETTNPLIAAKMLKAIAKVISKNVRFMDGNLLKILIGY